MKNFGTVINKGCLQLKKVFIKYIRFIIPLILVCIAIIVFRSTINDDYRANLVTELIGAIITVIVVDYLYQLKDNNEKNETENKKVLNINNLISVYITDHLKYLYTMINPFGKTNKAITSIELGDLQYIYDVCGLRFAPFFVKNYQLYFDSLKRLTEVLKQQIVVLDIELSKGLIEIIQEFIRENDTDIIYLSIHERFSTIYGGEEAWKKDIEFLKNVKGELDFPSNSSTNDIYIQLYKQIRNNISIIDRYLVYINGIKK